MPWRHRSPRGRAWEALWCPRPAHGGVDALCQHHLARGGVCATRFACPGRFGRRARSSRPCRATGQLPSAALRVCARPVQTPAVRVAHVNLGHSSSSRAGRRLASPARAPAATALPVAPETCSAGPERRGRHAPPPTSWPTPGCSAPRGGCRGNAQPGRGRIAAVERRREGKIWRLLLEAPETCSAGPERRGRHAPPRRAGRPPDAVHLAAGVAATCSPGEAASRPRNGAERARSGGSRRRGRRGRTRPGRTRPVFHPRMCVLHRFLVRAGLGVTWAVAAADTTPQVLPSVPTTHSALPGARARTAPAGPHAPPTHARAHTPHGRPGRPPGLLHHPRRPPSAAPHARDANARPEGTPARTHGDGAVARRD